jgi:hypothetical protein
MAIGNLQVDLTLETGQFSANVKQAQVSIEGLTSSVVGVGAAFAGGLAAGAAMAALRAIGPLVRNITQQFEELRDVAFSLGQGEQGIAVLERALERVGLNSNQATSAIKAVGDVIQDAYFNKSSKARDALDMLGVSLLDQAGKARPVEQILYDLSDAWTKLPEGMDKARIAQELFGKSAREVSEALSVGSGNLKQAAADASGTADMWKSLADAIKSAGDSIKDGFTAALDSLMPVLTDVGAELKNSSAGFELIKQGVAIAVGALAAFMSMIASVIGSIGKMIDAVSKGGEALSALGSAVAKGLRGDFEGAGRQMTEFGNKAAEVGRTTEAAFDQAFRAPDKAIADGANAYTAMADKFAVGEKKYTTALNQTGQATDELREKTRQLFGDREKVSKGGGGGVDELLQWSQRILDAVDPMRVYNREIEKLNQAWAAGLLKGYEYADVVAKIKEQTLQSGKGLSDQFDELNRSIVAFGSRVGDAFIDAIANGKDFGQVLKALITDLAKMFFRLLVMKPLMDFMFPTGASASVVGFAAPVSMPTFAARDAASVTGQTMGLVSPLSAVTGNKNQESQGSVNLGDMTINIDSRGGSEKADQEQARELAKKIRQSVVAVLVDERRPGGLLAGAR